jgi:Domain of unknown function (DUF4277)
MKTEVQIDVQDLDHLGIIAGIVDEIGKAEYLNDSRLGRVLDQIYEYGISLLFVKIAVVMAKRFEIEPKILHIDGTSMSV